MNDLHSEGGRGALESEKMGLLLELAELNRKAKESLGKAAGDLLRPPEMTDVQKRYQADRNRMDDLVEEKERLDAEYRNLLDLEVSDFGKYTQMRGEERQEEISTRLAEIGREMRILDRAIFESPVEAAQNLEFEQDLEASRRESKIEERLRQIEALTNTKFN